MECKIPISVYSSDIDERLRTIINQRLADAKKCEELSPLAAIFMYGSALEGILLALSKNYPKEFGTSDCAPKDENGKGKKTHKWTLGELIDVASSLNLIPEDAKKFSVVLRDYRNFIHPNEQLKADFVPVADTARMCGKVVKRMITCLNTNIPSIFLDKPEPNYNYWVTHQQAQKLGLAMMIGAWNDENDKDKESVSSFLGLSYDMWLNTISEMLQIPDCPIYFNDGTWKISNREQLWSHFAPRLLDKDISQLMTLALTVLQEKDSSFDLTPDKRFMSNFYCKGFSYSAEIRFGLVEGLAMLGNRAFFCSNCSQNKIKELCYHLIDTLLAGADWKMWGSINDLLPTLAEVAPFRFLTIVEQAISATPCPFDTLFTQEGNGVFGHNYLTGLLWALEGLAWDEKYLVRVCVILGKLAEHDPGGRSANRPLNSLITILQPWFPQTVASAEKRIVAIQTVLRENPLIGWKLLMCLLPDTVQTSMASHKPRWFMVVPEASQKHASEEDCAEQYLKYAEIAVAQTGSLHIDKTVALIDKLDKLPPLEFAHFLRKLSQPEFIALPDDQRLPLWEHLEKILHKHRRFSDSSWALPEELLVPVAQVVEKLAPNNIFYLSRYLFSGNDFDYFEDNQDWDVQQKVFNEKRKEAITLIYQQEGLEGIFAFARTVTAPYMIGPELGAINDAILDVKLLPEYLNMDEEPLKTLLEGFIAKRQLLQGWEWCDSQIKNNWTREEVGCFLAFLPFTQETWDRASKWLGTDAVEYWSKTPACAPSCRCDQTQAVAKLLACNRPFAAINCLFWMLHDKRNIDIDQCIQVLLVAGVAQEADQPVDSYYIIKLISHLQSAPIINKKKLAEIEWIYLPFLNNYNNAEAKQLQRNLASDPEFFCTLISCLYGPCDTGQTKETDDAKVRDFDRTRAYKLFHQWKIVPGTDADGVFNPDLFIEWIRNVKKIATQNGNINAAYYCLGEVLIHAPADEDGLWLDRTIAETLNAHDAEKMRSGFKAALYNSRGVHFVDPTGSQEKALAKQYYTKAEAIENACFQRIATTLQEVVEHYEREYDNVKAGR